MYESARSYYLNLFNACLHNFPDDKWTDLYPLGIVDIKIDIIITCY